jgi:TPP-dependent pyruvate/acetoin dehydrogenase alpha subunit
MKHASTQTTSLDLLDAMVKIRTVEETIAARYNEGKMRCPTHLSIGQEAVSAGVGLALRSDDLAVSTHRAHGHYLGKGGNLPRMIAEIYGKESGCSGGLGGSMHLIDRSVGFMGSTAIVGNTIPVGVGLGLSLKLQKGDQVACIFLGDGAVEEGAFYESANFAVLKKLPVLFVCENNLYSVYSPLRVRQPENRRIFELVRAIGLMAEHYDGNDMDLVYQTCSDALAKIRAGEGPVFLEYSTYRWREHCGPNFDNDIGYRTEEEYLEWKARDPILLGAQNLKNKGLLTDEGLATIQQKWQRAADEAFLFAEKSDFPDASILAGLEYAGGK